MNKYQRETTEFVPVTVTVDGVPVLAGVQFSVTASFSTRPTAWANAVTLNGEIGIMLTAPNVVGSYRIWAKIASSPETPVIDCGTYQVI